MDAADESTLLGELAEGGEGALAALFERHRRAVYAQAFMETGSRADAEEVLQDAFLLLWQKRRRIRLVGGSVLPWLLVTARNLARNRRRYQQRRSTAQLFEGPADQGEDPEAIGRGENWPGCSNARSAGSTRSIAGSCSAVWSTA